jgi:hypothetical protein
VGRVQFEPRDALERGFAPVGVDLAFRRDMTASTLLEPFTLVRLQAPPGSTGGLVLVTARELEASAHGITEYARTHARGLELEVVSALAVRMGGVDRHVAFTAVRTHRGDLATSWALFPSLVEDEAVVAVAWIEGSRGDLGPEEIVDAYNDEFGSLLLKFEAGMTFGDARAVVRMDSRGGLRVSSVEGDESDGSDLVEHIREIDGSTLCLRSEVHFTRCLRRELEARGVRSDAGSRRTDRVGDRRGSRAGG